MQDCFLTVMKQMNSYLKIKELTQQFGLSKIKTHSFGKKVSQKAEVNELE